MGKQDKKATKAAVTSNTAAAVPPPPAKISFRDIVAKKPEPPVATPAPNAARKAEPPKPPAPEEMPSLPVNEPIPVKPKKEKKAKPAEKAEEAQPETVEPKEARTQPEPQVAQQERPVEEAEIDNSAGKWTEPVQQQTLPPSVFMTDPQVIFAVEPNHCSEPAQKAVVQCNVEAIPDAEVVLPESLRQYVQSELVHFHAPTGYSRKDQFQQQVEQIASLREEIAQHQVSHQTDAEKIRSLEERLHETQSKLKAVEYQAEAERESHAKQLQDAHNKQGELVAQLNNKVQQCQTLERQVNVQKGQLSDSQSQISTYKQQIQQLHQQIQQTPPPQQQQAAPLPQQYQQPAPQQQYQPNTQHDANYGPAGTMRRPLAQPQQQPLQQQQPAYDQFQEEPQQDDYMYQQQYEQYPVPPQPRYPPAQVQVGARGPQQYTVPVHQQDPNFGRRPPMRGQHRPGRGAPPQQFQQYYDEQAVPPQQPQFPQQGMDQYYNNGQW